MKPVNTRNRELNIVYYAYIDRQSAWREIISGQLQQLKSYGLFDDAELYVHVTDGQKRFDEVENFIRNIYPFAIFSCSSENRFEFDALKLVYELARLDPQSIYIYLHTKGMSHHIASRDIDEIALTTGTFQNWRENIEIFKNKNINKIGLFPAIEDYYRNPKSRSVGGWIWFNFWYATGTYLAKCSPPSITSNRYIFEEWLGGDQNDEAVASNDCYSIFSRSNTYYNATEACTKLEYIRSKIRFVKK